MYYEEKIIDGILCWRNTPTGYWLKCSDRKITEKLIEAEAKALKFAHKITQLERSLSRARTIESTKAQFLNESG